MILRWTVVVALHIIYAQAELDRVFIHCCNLGRNYGRTSSNNCDDYPTPISGVQRQDQYWCGVSLGVCCREEAILGKCDDGKTAAQENQDCATDESGLGGDEFKQCCDCCQLGLLAGSSGYGKQCDSAGFQITKCNKIYKECCEFSKLRQSRTNGTVAAPHEFPRARAPRPTIPSSGHEEASTEFPVEPEPSAGDGGVNLCGVGYDFHAGIGQCLDINECNRKLHTCTEIQKCVNTIGSYKCESPLPEPARDDPVYVSAATPEDTTPRLCPGGYQNNPRTGRCEDIDECATQQDNCGVGMRCENEAGTYRCIREISCGTGYTYDAHRRECTDNDECVLGNHNCGIAYECVNTQGSFRCTAKTCPKKMRLDYERGTCSHVDCQPGFEPGDDGVCLDTNECLANPNSCKRNQDCYNTVGSHVCRDKLNCGGGYILNDLGDKCVDVDECSDGTHTCVGGQTCENRPGSFVCNCREGFEFNVYKKQCDDIDECRFGASSCPSSADCQNFPGSFRCNCKEGFRQGPLDGNHCKDVDECEEHNPCQQGCTNRWGGYNCTCKTGFRLAPDLHSCEDIDECADKSLKLCFGDCINTYGGYNCSCPSGFQMLQDGQRCQDIDECQTLQYCNRHDQVCVNTEGGYQCHAIRCPSGYIQDPDQKNRCRRLSLVCPVGDANCLQQPISYSYNFMAIPSNPNFPLTGRIDLFTMRGPQQPNTNVEFDLTMKRAQPLMLAVMPADRRFFDTRTTGYNQATIALVRPLEAPQEVELEMLMTMTTNGIFSGKAVATITIAVTKSRTEAGFDSFNSRRTSSQ